MFILKENMRGVCVAKEDVTEDAEDRIVWRIIRSFCLGNIVIVEVDNGCRRKRKALSKDMLKKKTGKIQYCKKKKMLATFAGTKAHYIKLTR